MLWGIELPVQLATDLRGDLTDAELAEACKRGNLHAFERLYEIHASRMKSLAFHLLGSHADAEDVVQEAFVKVYRGVGGFGGRSSLTPWIYRIVLNCCYDHLRKRQRLAEDPAPAQFSTDAKVALKVALERALAALNERQRTVFLMFEVEGLRHSEIAAILEVPEGTSRSWLFEAKSALKRILMGAGGRL